MKIWTTFSTGRRVLHAQIGRWKLSARCGRFRVGWERQAAGAYVGSIGPVFVTALRQHKQKTPPSGGVSSGPIAPARVRDSPIVAGSER